MADIAVILVAAGSSSRMGGTVPKPYLPLMGKPVICHSIEKFKAFRVLAVIHPDHQALFNAAATGIPSIAGGDTRQQSVLNGLRALADTPPDYVLIHDAARPFLDDATIARVIDALGEHQAAIPAIAVTDTIKQIEAGRVVATPDRATLRAVQTPQGFHYAALLAAHQAAPHSNFTDDAAIMEAAGIAVAVVEGHPHNRKLTTPEDMHMQATTRSAMGFDVHRLIENPMRRLMICGVEIPSSLALDGHSDADVGLHALVDAMLGSIAAGDIGQHFPPTDARWKNADSADFVAHALALLEQAGARLTHIDITLIAEQPKISPHRDAMRKRVSELLSLDISCVSIKATTTEGLGFTGRGEGIAAQAMVSVTL